MIKKDPYRRRDKLSLISNDPITKHKKKINELFAQLVKLDTSCNLVMVIDSKEQQSETCVKQVCGNSVEVQSVGTFLKYEDSTHHRLLSTDYLSHYNGLPFDGIFHDGINGKIIVKQALKIIFEKHLIKRRGVLAVSTCLRGNRKVENRYTLSRLNSDIVLMAKRFGYCLVPNVLSNDYRLTAKMNIPSHATYNGGKRWGCGATATFFYICE